jgi:hypothetical protein
MDAEPTPAVEMSEGSPERRWWLVRGLILLVFSVATSACSLILLGLGGIILAIPLLIVALILSFMDIPFRWVAWGFLISPGLFIGFFRMPFFSRAEPSVGESILWASVGLLGFGMVLFGYCRLFFGDED